MSTPDAARLRLGRRLKSIRIDRGNTVERAASAVGFSASKLSRMESGAVAVSRPDLAALLTLYEVDSDTGRYLARLRAEQTTGRRRGYWTHYGPLPPYARFLALEMEAYEYRHYQPIALPGLFQSPAYAKAIIETTSYERSEWERERDYRIRMHRQELVIGSGKPYSAVVCESALRRNYGGRPVMAEAIAHMIALVRRPHITIRLMPDDKGHGAIVGPFLLMMLPDGIRFGFAESVAWDLYLREPFDTTSLDALDTLFDRLVADALDPDTSLDRLQRIRVSWLDDPPGDPDTPAADPDA